MIARETRQFLTALAGIFNEGRTRGPALTLSDLVAVAADIVFAAGDGGAAARHGFLSSADLASALSGSYLAERRARFGAIGGDDGDLSRTGRFFPEADDQVSELRRTA